MTSGWKEKVGEGLSKVQGGIDQGKQKLQTTQEATRLKRDLQHRYSDKSEILLQLGQEAYRKLREGTLVDPELEGLSAKLIEKDVSIFMNQKELTNLMNDDSQAVVQCSHCQKENAADALFCGGCGTAIAAPVTEEEAMVSCHVCSIDRPQTANFCPCCGTSTLKKEVG
ncbi:zinc ribbon domain-containing protein [Alkalicoccobacillus porphyridii]|uniref:Zinc ribbon domain-containing protein n=1 Tax=Alkalicoccobacillus porphyridii TaxID=2597270 RepID=A0A554A489_9BACI|nr:zinc ribbon domain-containing protein [Alkalicoccobacillus porphyridii]TSB48504.1 zinc ribbon domain-containing protein [Alkalicoccobacillus porphyridii]